MKGTNGTSATSSYIAGGISIARNAPNTVESASVQNYGGTSYRGAYFFVTDFTGVSKYCYTSNANLLAIFASVQSDSYVSAYVATTGECTNVYVTTASYWEPKLP